MVDNGNDAVAFRRGDKCYLILKDESSALDRSFHTNLPASAYCDNFHADYTIGHRIGPPLGLISRSMFPRFVDGRVGREFTGITESLMAWVGPAIGVGAVRRGRGIDERRRECCPGGSQVVLLVVDSGDLVADRCDRHE
ncbi:hypothetical protein E0H75_42630 [Kribbella capetownensis]|uniref:Alpha-amylase/branching enzyme C-terminal all beta domain-containing protein n=1 Tax=Kribbella capetownensis TaxID=1572659 RepID=A0A4R0IK56_9ACTN|nr:alpha amylase C-terminal domain-containing protein [Kribbella capetownensis]TCC32640.1 hypothetical protein E0H75_42630 [Kribbella capetownensis]